MVFSRFFYGAGITLLAVFFLVANAAIVVAMPKADERVFTLCVDQYQSMRKAYDDNEWQKVIVDFNSYKNCVVVPERKVLSNFILHMSRDDIPTQKRQIRKHNAVRGSGNT